MVTRMDIVDLMLLLVAAGSAVSSFKLGAFADPTS
jgi:hypothetical protein